MQLARTSAARAASCRQGRQPFAEPGLAGRERGRPGASAVGTGWSEYRTGTGSRRYVEAAFCTLPAFRQRVQTYARFAAPLTRIRTRCRFGSNRRLVATIEWLRLLPNEGFFPQTTQILDTR